MSEPATSDFRSPLGSVRGLGSAKSGARTWLVMRLTSLAMVPLGLWFLGGLIAHTTGSGYIGARAWLASPSVAVLMVLFLGVGFHHAAQGMREVLEDYVRDRKLKFVGMTLVTFLAWSLAVSGIVAVLMILFGQQP